MNLRSKREKWATSRTRGLVKTLLHFSVSEGLVVACGKDASFFIRGHISCIISAVWSFKFIFDSLCSKQRRHLYKLQYFKTAIKVTNQGRGFFRVFINPHFRSHCRHFNSGAVNLHRPSTLRFFDIFRRLISLEPPNQKILSTFYDRYLEMQLHIFNSQWRTMIHQFHCKVREPKVCYRTIRSKHSSKAVSFRILVFERVGISLDEGYERVEKSVISVFKKACSKWLTDAFYGCVKVQETFRFCGLILF